MTDKPNLLFIFSDQQHYQALGHVDSSFETPNLDALAAESVSFTNAFCTTPQCSPSRSSILSGFYPSRTGVWGNVGAAGFHEMPQSTFGLPLKQAGYRTAYFGKWHLGTNPAPHEGWDVMSKATTDAGADTRYADLHKDEATTRKCVEYIAEQNRSEKPFAICASYVDPHDIYRFNSHDDCEENTSLPQSWHSENFDAKPAVQQQFMQHDQGSQIDGDDESQWHKYRNCYREKTKLLDSHIGRVIDALKSAGLYDNTIIIFTSDHGDMDANHRLIYKGPFMYEHMLRVPLMIRPVNLPPEMAGSSVEDFDTVNVDLVPTILELCGAGAIDCDGVSLVPLLNGGQMENREFVVAEYYSKQKWVNPIRTIRTRKYKYNRYASGDGELYDLVNDPHELTNLINVPACGAELENLQTQLDSWIQSRNDPFKNQLPTTIAGELVH